MKKPLPIEVLLRWAWRDELPKGQVATTFLRPDKWAMPWGAITKTGMLGTEIQEPDVRNRYGVTPDMNAQGPPHIDAIRVWQAVQDLIALTVTIPADWNPIADLGDLGPYGPASIAKAIDRLCFRRGKPAEAEPVDHSVRRWRPGKSDETLALRRPVAEVVARYAVLGGTPQWQAEPPELRTVLDQGKPKWFRRNTVSTETGSIEVEVDGFDRKRRIPHPDAYLKHYYDPDPADPAEARAEYEIWHAALDVLGKELAGRLDDHLVLPSEHPARPWQTGAVPQPRILIDLRPQQPLVHEPRPVAGPPPKRGIEKKRAAAR